MLKLASPVNPYSKIHIYIFLKVLSAFRLFGAYNFGMREPVSYTLF